MKITMNEKRTAVIETLKNATAPMTLAEIANAASIEVKSGTTNAMVKVGLIVVAGEREIVCPACGHKQCQRGCAQHASLGRCPAQEAGA